MTELIPRGSFNNLTLLLNPLGYSSQMKNAVIHLSRVKRRPRQDIAQILSVSVKFNWIMRKLEAGQQP